MTKATKSLIGLGVCLISATFFLAYQAIRNKSDERSFVDDKHESREKQPAPNRQVERSIKQTGSGEREKGRESLFVDGFDPARFDEQWKLIERSSRSGSDKMDEKVQLVWLASKAGGGKEVLQKVFESTGVGSDRNRFISVVFSTPGTPLEDAESLMAMITDAKAQKTAERAFSDRIGKVESLDELQPLLVNPSDWVLRAVKDGMPKYASARGTRAGLDYVGRLSEVKSFLTELPGKPDPNAFSETLYWSIAGQDAFSAWSYLSGLGEVESLGLSKKSTDRVVLEMIFKDPAQALGTVSNTSQPFEYAVKAWHTKRIRRRSCHGLEAMTRNWEKYSGKFVRKQSTPRIPANSSIASRDRTPPPWQAVPDWSAYLQVRDKEHKKIPGNRHQPIFEVGVRFFV